MIKRLPPLNLKKLALIGVVLAGIASAGVQAIKSGNRHYVHVQKENLAQAGECLEYGEYRTARTYLKEIVDSIDHRMSPKRDDCPLLGISTNDLNRIRDEAVGLLRQMNSITTARTARAQNYDFSQYSQ
jgi:hypothetical protein